MTTPTLPPVRVLLTRPTEQAEGWAQALRQSGALPVSYPTITVGPPPSWQPMDEAIERLSGYDWIVFTSAAAARFTVGRTGAERLAGVRVAAVGAETARALASLGVPVAVVPNEQHGVGLAQALSQLGPGTRVLFPQALGGRVELREALAAQGCHVDVVPASQTLPVSPLPAVPAFDVATFASPSALRAFVAGAGLAPLQSHPFVVLGPTTAATASALGLEPETAAAPNAAGLVAAVAASLAKHPR